MKFTVILHSCQGRMEATSAERTTFFSPLIVVPVRAQALKIKLI